MTNEELLNRKIRELEEESSHARDQMRFIEVERCMAREEERRSLGYQLEGQIGQKLGAAQKRIKRLMGKDIPERLAHELAILKQLVESSLRESDSIVIEMSPSVLYQEGIESAIGWISGQIKKYFGISIHLSGRFPPYLTISSRVIIYKAVREVLVAMVKFSKPKNIYIRTVKEENLVRISLEDDGPGFDSPGLYLPEAGSGLASAGESLRALGGFFIFESSPPEGTRAMIVAPC